MISHEDYFPSARPEPVEGYLGALEEILQQVQDERKKIYKRLMIFGIFYYPIEFSISIAIRRLISTAYSIGSNCTNASINPLTINARADCSLSPRDCK